MRFLTTASLIVLASCGSGEVTSYVCETDELCSVYHFDDDSLFNGENGAQVFEQRCGEGPNAGRFDGSGQISCLPAEWVCVDALLFDVDTGSFMEIDLYYQSSFEELTGMSVSAHCSEISGDLEADSR